jgi:hypothetical protein
VQKLSPGSVTNHLCALRFFYVQTLKKPWSIADTPYPKKRYRLPTILSPEEVAQLIDAAPTPFYRTVLMTLYGVGVRRAELTRLKVSDIDSRRMVVHIQGGKSRQDRDVMLSPVLRMVKRKGGRNDGKISLCSASDWSLSPDGISAGHGKRICLAVRNRSQRQGPKMQVQLLDPGEATKQYAVIF